MIINERVSAGHDSFSLVKIPEAGSRLGFSYKFILSPRYTDYSAHFQHQESIRIVALTGKILLEVDGETCHLDRGIFVDIPANIPYRLRGLEFQPVQGYIFSEARDIIESWKEAAQKLSAITDRNGNVHYR